MKAYIYLVLVTCCLSGVWSASGGHADLPAFSGILDYSDREVLFPEKITGALSWAHKRGIKGKGVSALVLEPSETIFPDILSEKVKFLSSFMGMNSHGLLVTRVLFKVAPEAGLFYGAVRGLDFMEAPPPGFGDVFVVNGSFAPYGIRLEKDMRPGKEALRSREISYTVEDTSRTFEKLKEGGAQDFIFVLAAGNINRHEDFATKRFYHKLKEKNPETPILMVGALNQFNDFERFEDTNDPEIASNRPGSDRDLQKSFIFSFGNNFKDKLERERDRSWVYHKDSGTSFAAPIVSGTVALLKAQYPRLTAAQIKKILLFSADRTFFVRRGKTKTIFVYENEEESGETRNYERGYRGVKLKLTREKFDPAIYGQGILNIKNALHFAGIFSQDPHRRWEDSVALYKRDLSSSRKKAATKIQRAWRKKR